MNSYFTQIVYEMLITFDNLKTHEQILSITNIGSTRKIMSNIFISANVEFNRREYYITCGLYISVSISITTNVMRRLL